MADLELPGFRFHPTEEELLNFYLKKVVYGHKLHFDIIGFLNIYRHDPWELPGLAKIGEREWYFYVPRDRKQGPSGAGRPNRTTLNGFWKATGSDRTIRCLTDPKKNLGLRKTLVFYNGRAPRGSKTDWVMNEYRLMPQNCSSKEDIVLCKIYRKATSLKVLEQRAAMEEEEMERAAMEEEEMFKSSSSSPEDSFMSASLMESEINIFCNSVTNEEVQECEHEQEQEQDQAQVQEQEPIKEEHVEDVHEVTLVNKEAETCAAASVAKPSLLVNDKFLPQLQLPGKISNNLDWMQDPFFTQIRSPWLDNWMTPTYANLLL